MTDISRIYYLHSASISRIVEGFNTYNTGISYNLPQTTSTNQSNEGVRLQEDPSNHLTPRMNSEVLELRSTGTSRKTTGRPTPKLESKTKHRKHAKKSLTF